MDRIFKDEAARLGLAAWHRRFLARAAVPAESRSVPTSLGPSHVLLAGDPAKPPLVCLHGSQAGSAHTLLELGLLADRYRIVAPDIPARSALGPQVRLPLKDDAQPRWLLEVLDGLGLGRIDLLGVSWGGFVARQTATFAPHRVRRLALGMPAGVVAGSLWKAGVRMLAPMLLYRTAPTERRLKAFVDAILTTWDDDWAHYLGDAVRAFRIDLNVPPLATDAELRGLAMPTLVLGAEGDLYFPGAKLLARVKALVPNVETELIAGSRHVPPTTDAFRRWLADRVTAFLEAGGRD